MRPCSEQSRRPARPLTLLLAAAIVSTLSCEAGGPPAGPAAAAQETPVDKIPFNGTRAYDYLKQLCALGSRASGSPGMAAQQKLLEAHFARLGGKVELQRFRYPHPINGRPLPMANLVVQWKPQAAERILLAAHYDTRPFPDLDREDPRGLFVGANDGASGTALLMELAHEMPTLATRAGVDFVLFDAEEFIIDNRGQYFLGSEFFARRYKQQRPAWRYTQAVVLDMIADADLQLFYERNSTWFAEGRTIVEQIWATAARLGVTEFVAEKRHEIRDDHLPLYDIAGIPACVIIDFDYPAWHTRADTPERCSAASLAKVGWVIREWLRSDAK